MKQLTPTETTTDITDALKLAETYATTGTRVVVISDFNPTAGDTDYNTEADAVAALGAIVNYLPVTSPATHNVGIIDLAVGPVTSTVWIKNYDAQPEQITLQISDAEQQVLLAPGETKEVDFKTPAGVTQVHIKEDDDLLADNTAWTSTPAKNNVKILLITNNQAVVQKSNLLVALNVISQNFPTTYDITYAIPPEMPDLDGYDVYIIDDTDLNLLLPGNIRDIKTKVGAGASFIAFTQNDLFSIDWQGLLPVQPANDTNGLRASITAPAVTTLTQDVEFGQTSNYLRVIAAQDATIVAATPDDPIIVLGPEGQGHVLYYGLDDSKASFSKDPSYPVFWRRIFDLLTNRPSLENLNLHTGAILSLPVPENIKTPTGTITASMLPLENAGLYVLPDRTIAANMLSDGESNLATQNVSKSQTAEEATAQTEKEPLELTDYILWAAIAFVLLELLYIKYRGDF